MSEENGEQNRLKADVLNAATLRELYVNQKLPGTKIAEMANVSYVTVYYWLEKYGIKRRDRASCHIDQKVWNKGLTKSDPRVNKYASKLVGRKLSESCIEKIRKAATGRKKNWVNNHFFENANKDPVFIRKRLKGLIKKPTKPEREMISLIEKLKLPYIYNGNGRALIGTFCPDFMHLYEKKVIEIFGRAYHDPLVSWFKVPSYQKERPRIAIYLKNGYKCAIIWEDEIKEDLVLSKINKMDAA